MLKERVLVGHIGLSPLETVTHCSCIFQRTGVPSVTMAGISSTVVTGVQKFTICTVTYLQ